MYAVQFIRSGKDTGNSHKYEIYSRMFEFLQTFFAVKYKTHFLYSK